MCARLLACPLCSQPGFLNLDALRMGLVSVATRPLACPVCNEILLGIDKLTIHLFGHTINQGGGVTSELSKIIEVTSSGNGSVQAIVRNAQSVPIQSWNVLNTPTINSNEIGNNAGSEKTSGSGIYIPINEIETYRNLTTIKEGNNIISLSADQHSNDNPKGGSNQVIFLQNISTEPKIFSTNVVDQQPTNLNNDAYKTASITALPNQTDAQINDEGNTNESNDSDVVVVQVNGVDEIDKETHAQSSNQNFPPSYTDRLADLVKNAQITSSPLSCINEQFENPRPKTPPEPSRKPILKSTRILPASEKTERCNICGFHFPDRNILILHKQLIHMVDKKDSNVTSEELMKNYPCHLCTKAYKMRGCLMLHMRVAHPGLNTSTSNSSIKALLRRREQQKLEVREQQKQDTKEQQNHDMVNDAEVQTNIECDNEYHCPICGKCFKKEHQVTQHLKIHDTKQWECDVCSKMFTTKYFLKKHKRLHSGEMPYKCTICDKTFTFQQSYHKHRLYHRDEKPHTCSACGRSFKELSTLHNHERIHTGEKPFACETCGKCFRQRVSYLVHRRIHTGVMPYKCLACGKNFRYKVSQRTHKCIHHNPDDQKSSETSDITEIQDISSQDEQSIDTPFVKENNQYVFVLNKEGQHVLKRKLDVKDTQEENDNSDNQANEHSDASSDFMQSIWKQDTNNGLDYKKNNYTNNGLVSNTTNDSNKSQISDSSALEQFNINDELGSSFWNQTSPTEVTSINKNQTNEERNYFSLGMPSLDADTSSPSSEMEHLRLSSPENNNQENSSSGVNDCFPLLNNNINPVQINQNNTEENFNDNSINLSTLQTINEDSLKELLNSIVDK